MAGRESLPGRRAEPVVLLHGLFRTHRSMASAARWLEGQGFESHNLDYPSRKHSLEGLARIVDRQITEIFEGDERRVHFLTHSMGGIVLRQIVALRATGDLNIAWHMGRTVMLASPNRGSSVAEVFGGSRAFYFLMGEAGQELRARPESPVPDLPMPKEVGLIAGVRSVGSYRWVHRDKSTSEMRNDGTVAVGETRMEGVPLIEVTSGHTFIMNSQEALEQAACFFRTGRFEHGERGR